MIDDACKQIDVIANHFNMAETTLAVEEVVFDRLLYKFKNAHRRCIYYRKLIHVQFHSRLKRHPKCQDFDHRLEKQ